MMGNWLEMAQSIRLEEFVYDLPDDKIARYPLAKRDDSKLLCYKNGTVAHKKFGDIVSELPENTLLVFNNTKVIPARAYFRKATGAVIQLLLLHPELPTRVINEAMLVTGACVWECMIGNKKKWKTTDYLETKLTIDGIAVAVQARYQDFDRNLVRLSWDSTHIFLDIVNALGEIPLPPYLNRESEERDKETYQTIYAKNDGAVAAPTAGLHFTEEVLSKLTQKGVRQGFLTLHVGAGTFQPIKVDSITEHRMHSEQIVFTRETLDMLIRNIDNIVPVGTTSMRSLESLYWYGVKLYRKETEDFFIEKLYPYSFELNKLPSVSEALHSVASFMDSKNLSEIVGETEIFIFPGYVFKICKGLITNFHQPGSTLILLVAALVGNDWKSIYEAALSNHYRFLSYGDSSLLWRA